MKINKYVSELHNAGVELLEAHKDQSGKKKSGVYKMSELLDFEESDRYRIAHLEIVVIGWKLFSLGGTSLMVEVFEEAGMPWGVSGAWHGIGNDFQIWLH